MTDCTQPIAALDIGSNTVRIVTALPRNGALDTVLDLSAFVRLGMGVDTTSMIDPARADHAAKVIREFKGAAEDAGADAILAVATSAVRDARNGSAFVERLHRDTGLEVQIISGDREAELTFKGATLGINLSDPLIVVDLGGGSGEIIASNGAGMQWGKALPIGSGRLTERFIRHDPPRRDELEAVAQYVQGFLKELPALDARHAVYTGGTARHVPLLLGLTGAEVRLSQEGLDRALDVLVARSSHELVTVHDIELNRAQVLPAGTAALKAVARFYHVDDVTISSNGIRQGMIVDYLQHVGCW